MKPSFILRIALWVARGSLAAVFFYSGFAKMGMGESFTITILSFGILMPVKIAKFIAITLPWAECLAAVLLLLPRVYRIGAAMIAGFCLLFIMAVGWALSQGILVDCGCFGESAPSFEKMWQVIGRDVFLLFVALAIFAASLCFRKKAMR